ncbi:hypothetical protein OS493_034619 [Desmophyllum pertusum]|uniref:Uncharacterized protein n=1 Tax=Desmophyllum pertusum TaxID=174260 RepID=A0A9W9ZK83_9CNID|nr:hypothetical protein OS493_034619 [Desmophyllum pertusum]
MAFMPGDHCYGVDCFSPEHCEITTVKPVSVEDPSTQEELHCTQSPMLKNVTLRGGIKAGNFSDLGDEKNIAHVHCAMLRERKTCDLAFMIGGTCIAVDWFQRGALSGSQSEAHEI